MAVTHNPIAIITRRFEFDAGHRVLGHEGKCKNLHGHRYVAELTVRAPQLDQLGRVLDFGVIKEVVGKWIDANWDHNFLCNTEDPIWKLMHSPQLSERTLALHLLSGKFPFSFDNSNPTAENMAAFLFHRCEGLLPQSIVPVRVKLYETPNCWAEYPSHGQ